MPKRQLLWNLAEIFLSLIFLFYITYLTVVFFLINPYTAFRTNKNVVVYEYTAGQIQLGDEIQRMAGITAEAVNRDLRVSFYSDLKVGQTIEIMLLRSGQPVTLQYTIPKVPFEEVAERLASQWPIPFIFWLAGAATLLFLRPRGSLRTLLALFCYLTAAWLSPSILSDRHFWNAALALRSTAWLAVPVTLHLHWLFPVPLRPLPRALWGLLYVLCAGLAVLQWLQWVPESMYYIGVALMLLGSLALLGLHMLRRPGERRALAGLAAALGLALLPVLGASVFGAIGQLTWTSAVFVLGIAALPGFYFFTLFRRQLNPAQARGADRLVRVYAGVLLAGLLFSVLVLYITRFSPALQSRLVFSTATFAILLVVALVNFIPFLILPALARESVSLALGGVRFGFSANRAAAGISFLLLAAPLALLLVLPVSLADAPGAQGLSPALAALLAGGAALLGYPAYARFFERRVLGMPHTPEALARAYAGRIATSLERPALQKLLLDEALPSLLVRQFAQYEPQAGGLAPAFGLRVPPEDPAPQLEALARAAGRPLGPDEPGLPGWARLALELRAEGRARGWWLLGRRDPDDHYSDEDIAVLQSLADQTALALVNIEQSEALRALYFADMEREEAERLTLAAELHDDVLNQLAQLSLELPEQADAAQRAYAEAVRHVRQVINGLRPPMLDYGLYTALRTLADELNDRLPAGGPQVTLDLPPSDVRYPARVELALYRVAQQACANAIQHAACRAIRIGGSLAEGRAELTVSDDGRGLPGGPAPDLPALLRGKHFGLAGMLERAALIDAALELSSAPGAGTRVALRWPQKM